MAVAGSSSVTVGVTGGLGMLMPPYIPLGCTRNRFLFETPLLCCLTFLVALTYCTTSTRGQEMKTDRFEINQQLFNRIYASFQILTILYHI